MHKERDIAVTHENNARDTFGICKVPSPGGGGIGGRGQDRIQSSLISLKAIRVSGTNDQI